MSDGGAESLVRDYCRLLEKDGFEVVVVTLYPFNHTANSKLLRNIGIREASIFVDYSIKTRILNRLFGFYLIPKRLKKIIESEKPDCIHVHLSLLKYLAKIKKDLRGVKLFYTCHSEPDKILTNKKDEFHAAKVLVETNNLQLIGLHKEMANELNCLFGVDNTVVIRNGVDFGRFIYNPDISGNLYRKEIGIPQDSYVIGHIGRFSYPKNHEYLVDIFESVLSRKKNAFLLLVGNGELLQEIVDKLNTKGLVGKYLVLSNRPDIPQLLHCMDVFVLPSRYEGLPVTLVEAQVAGIRCVVSDRINKECILSEKTLVVDHYDNLNEWVDCILSEEMINVNHGDIDAFDINIEIKQLEQLYLKR